jgi:hypothetical protein
MPRLPTNRNGDWGIRVVWLARNRPATFIESASAHVQCDKMKAEAGSRLSAAPVRGSADGLEQGTVYGVLGVPASADGRARSPADSPSPIRAIRMSSGP